MKFAPFFGRIDVAERFLVREVDPGEAGSFEYTHDLQIAMLERGFDRGQQSPPVNRAQGLFASACDRKNSVGSREKRADTGQSVQSCCREARHVASDDQVPVVRGMFQRNMDSCQGTRSGELVRDHRRAETAVAGCVADDDNGADRLANRVSHALQQGLATKRQQRLVGAHPRTAAPGQHISSQVHPGVFIGPRHTAGMIALENKRLDRPQNRMLRNCLLVVAGAAALSVPARAEDRVVRSVVQTDLKTGKLVRRTVVAGSSPASRPAPQISELIDRIAAKNEVESPLVRSVIRAESNYNPLAVSNKGAQGLMQLIPSTAKRFGVKDSFDSEENIEGGVKYLKYLIALFHGDYAQAVAAYNAGEAAVAKYGGVPPYKETQNYVAEVARHLAAERRTVAAQAVAQGPAEAVVVDAAPVETYNPIVASVSPDGIVSYKTP